MKYHPIFDYIDPAVLSIGPFTIYWYGVSYVTGILLGYKYCVYISQKYKVNILSKQLDDFILWSAAGIVIGGRLGYIIFYNLPAYLEHPLEILKIHQGGMSFHGGLIGIIIAGVLFAIKNRINLLTLFDLIMCAAPIGLFFGRLANFVNAELVGRLTNSSIGIIFPGYLLPRHASQLYEAFFEGIILFLILFCLHYKYRILNKPGMATGTGIMLYSIFRIGIEFFREPDGQIGYLYQYFTMGQLLSIPMFITGIVILLKSRERNQ